MIKYTALLASALAIAVPAHANPAPETQIEAAGPHGPLVGTMIDAPARNAADAQRSVALIIPGSGPTDRDGNNPLGVRAASYRLLAEGLAAEGIASVRIDKRGMFGSAAAIPDANAVTIADYVADTAAWVDVIRTATGADCVWLLGHSEGGLVALAAAQQVKGLCGLVLIAAPGRPLGEVLKEQLRANPANAPLLGAAEDAIDRLAAGQRVDAATLPPALLPLFNPALQGYFISIMALDPADLAARSQLPILIVQGGKDLQVSVADAQRLKAANPSATLTILPDASHVLKDVAGNSPADNMATYTAPDLPLAKGIIAAIAGFIQQP
jgi:alpha-beta hydrolase superfamily lysophospholipase